MVLAEEKFEIKRIRKRDGKIVPFDMEKVTEAIWNAAQSVGGKDRKTAERLARKVVTILEYQFGEKEVPTVEEIQDIVERVLIKSGRAKTAKAYILYRQQKAKIRETKHVMVDAVNTIAEYLDQSDWRVRENSNEAFSFSGLLLHTAGKVMSNYNLTQMYTPAIAEAHRKGYVHIHDLSHGVIGYCAGWSLKNLLLMGFGGVPNKVDCKPAKHMSTVVHQMVNYIGCLQMEFAGAQAFSVHPKETIIIRDSKGNISVERIGEFCDRFIVGNPERWIGPHGIEYADISHMEYETLSFDGKGKSQWRPIKRAIRHPVSDPLHMIRTNKGTVSVSKSHSLFSLNSHQYLGVKEGLLLESIENDGKKLFSYELGDRAKGLGIKAPEKVVQKLVLKGMLNSEFMTYPGEVRHYSKYTPRNNEKDFVLKKTKELNRFCREVKTDNKEVSNIAVLSKLELPQKRELDLYDIIKGSKSLRKRVIIKVRNTDQLKRDITSKTSMRKLSLELGRCKGYVWGALKNRKVPFEIYDRFLNVKETDIEFMTKNSSPIKRVLKEKELMLFAKLIAWYLSEGYATRYWIGISQKNRGYIREITSILGSLGLAYHVSRRDVRAIIIHGIAAQIVKELCSKLSSNKRVPGFVFELTDELKKAFLEEIVKGDGTKTDRGWVYTSTSNRLITALNLLAMNLDWRTSIKMRHVKNFEENWGGRLTIYDLVMNTKATSRIERHGSFESAVVFENTTPDFESEYEYDLSVEGTESFVGGVGLFAMHNSSVDTLLAPFVRADGLNYREVKQNMQQLVFSLNIPSRWGSQFPFSNLTFDWEVPEDMKGDHAIVGGKEQSHTYEELKEEADMVNRAFIEVLSGGDAHGRIFSFPIPTYNVTRDFEWDTDNARLLFEMTAKYGAPYFQNYVGSDLDPSSIRAMCCRLNINQNELMNRPGSMWGPGDSSITGDTPVFLNVNGAWKFKPIEEIYSEGLKDFKTISFDPLTSEIKEANVSDCVNHGERDIFTLETNQGSMKITPDHCMFDVSDGGDVISVNMDDIKKTRYFLAPKLPKIGSLHELDIARNLVENGYKDRRAMVLLNDNIFSKLMSTKEAKDYIRKNYKKCFTDMKSNWKNSNFGRPTIPFNLFKVFYKNGVIKDSDLKDMLIGKLKYRLPLIADLDYDMGLLIGLFLAEGSSHEACLMCNSDSNLLKLCADKAKGVFKDNPVLYEPRKNKVGIVTFNSPFVSKYLELGLGLKGHSDTKAIPEYAFNSNVDTIKGIIDGYYLGDGYRSEDCIGLTTVSKKMAVGLMLLLKRIHSRVSLKEQKRIRRKRSYTIRISNYSSDVVSIEKIYGRDIRHLMGIFKSGVANLKKKTSTKEAINLGLPQSFYNLHYIPREGTVLRGFEILKRNSLMNGYFNTVLRFMENYERVDVSDIVYSGKENVYDLSVPGHENFVAGDGMFFTHNTGSIGVYTLNMNRLGYEARNEDEFLEKVGHYMRLGRDSLEIKRKVVERNLKNSLMPFTKVYLGTFRNHFSTIGLVGFNEACLNLLGEDIASPNGKALAIKTMNYMRERLREFQVETGSLYNLEATPAEGASYRLAREDKKLYGRKIITAGKEKPYLTNSTQLPVGYTDDLVMALEHQNDIQPLYTGGTIFHTFLGESLSDWSSAMTLVKKIACNTRLPYFSITPTFSICPVHGLIKGKHERCPVEVNGGK